MLASINANTLPLVVGIIIIGVCSLIPCFIGYDMIHVYERYAWIVGLFIMSSLYGLGGKAGYDVDAQKSFEDTGRALVADVLSYGSVIFGLLTGWAPVAADYNVRLPVDTNPWRVFLLTFFGLFLPSVFTQVLGAALMTITNPAYVAAFNSGSGGNAGALIAQVLSPWAGGGKFILVLLSLSVMYVPFILTPPRTHMLREQKIQCRQHCRHVFFRTLHPSSWPSVRNHTPLLLGRLRVYYLYRRRRCRARAL